MNSYQPLLQVVFHHGYFADNRCRHLQFVPDANCQKQLVNTGLSFQRHADGFSLIGDSQFYEALYLSASDDDEPLELVFKVTCNDPNFIYYTQPAVFQHHALLFFERQDLLGAADTSNRRLHRSSVVTDDDFKPLATLSDDGMEVGGVLKPGQQQKPMALIKLVINAQDIYQFFDPNGAPPPVYSVDFVEPTTIWKYFLTGDALDSNVMINDLDDKVLFDSGEFEQLPNGQRALTFQSQQALGLKERPSYRFVLKDKASNSNGASSKILIKRLPMASPANQYKALIDGKNTAISEIYINY